MRTSPSLYEPHCLLALAYENVGNLAAASKELQIAAQLRPDSPKVALEAARLLQMQSHFDDARTYINRALAMSQITPALRNDAADLLANQGDYAQATKIVQDHTDPMDVPAQLKLAGWYVRQNRPAEARGIYERLLSADPPPTSAIFAAASFYAVHDSLDKSKKTLERLDRAAKAPGTADYLRAEFAEQFGPADAAERDFVSATTAAPDNGRYWSGYVALRIRQHRYQDAVQLAEEAVKHVPKDSTLLALQHVAQGLVATSGAVPDLSPLAGTFAANPTHPAVVQLLAAVADAQSQKLSPDDALDAALKVVEQYPRFAALQLVSVQWNLQLHHLDSAAKIASRAVEQFPTDADAPRIAANVYRLMGNWELAAGAARQWHERTLDHPIDADLFLADARLHLHDAAGALRTLQPYLSKTDSPSEHRIAIATIAARAYAADNRLADAQQLLEPLLNTRNGRLLWLSFVGDQLPTADLCRRWIEKAAPLVPADSCIEQYALANAWYSAARRLSDRPMYDQAIRILDSLNARPDASTESLNLRGEIAQQLDDPKTAESNYRRSLQINRRQPATLNNLAYMLLSHSGDLKEANALVTEALKLAPQNADFYDTLARVQARSGDDQTAVESFRRALTLDPNNLHALIGLAHTLTTSGQKDAAAVTLDQIDSLLKVHPALSESLRQELDALRTSPKASIQ